MQKTFLLFLVAIGLSGCAEPGPVDIGPFPANHKEIMTSYIKSTFFDPYSLRDVQISDAVEGKIAWSKGWLFCFQCNAKNRMGGYTGLSKTAYLIRNNEIVYFESKSPYCETVGLNPWPEMEMAGGK